MFPILFSIGNLSVSSFGVFLALGFLFGVFLVWRLARAWDLDEEKVLDLLLLTFIGGLLGARIYFVIEHPQPFIGYGFSFWGGFLGGWLTLSVFAKRFRMDFWQLTDIAVVGLLGGLILSDVGFFLGGYDAGIPSTAFFAVGQEGMLGKRWPVQAVEALLLSFSLMRIWSLALRFHQRGKIVSLGFIYIGIIKLILLPFKQNHSAVIFAIIITVLGLVIFYKATGQNPIIQLKRTGKFLMQFIKSREAREELVQTLGKSWYNQKINFGWKLRSLKKLLKEA